VSVANVWVEYVDIGFRPGRLDPVIAGRLTAPSTTANRLESAMRERKTGDPATVCASASASLVPDEAAARSGLAVLALAAKAVASRESLNGLSVTWCDIPRAWYVGILLPPKSGKWPQRVDQLFQASLCRSHSGPVCLIERWRSRYQDNTRRSCLQLESTIVQVENEKLKAKIRGNLPRRPSSRMFKPLCTSSKGTFTEGTLTGSGG